MTTVIILFIIGLSLIIYSSIQIKKDKTLNEKDNFNFADALKENSDDISKEMIEIGKLRQEFGETIFELQEEIQNLNRKIEDYKVEIKVNERSNDIINSIDKNKIEEAKKAISIKETKNILQSNAKVQAINALLQKNMSIDEIAEELNMGKGEVQLIQEFYIK